MAISIKTYRTDEDLCGKTHWWGFPDLPDGVEYPVKDGIDSDGFEDTLTFVCQIRMEDIAPYDTRGLLPHEGILYFFADLDYFLGDMDACAQHLGFWGTDAFKVIYAPRTDNLFTHRVQWEDGSDACLPAEAMEFNSIAERAYGHKILGTPYYEEVEAEAPGMISLLQIDEDDDWGLRLFDLGMINFLITPDALSALDFSSVRLYFHCL